MMILQPILLSISIVMPLEVDSSQSSFDGAFGQSTFMPGSIIGNWEEMDNPDGTSTLEGVWGGSGNNLIPCELTPSLGGPFDSPCIGGLSIEPDTTFETLVIEDLLLAAFEDAPGTFPITLGMLYETFRTVQPSSLYPGGIQIDVPLGEGSLTSLQFAQITNVQTELVPIGEQAWSFTADIPILITMELVILETPSGPLVSPGFLQLAGTLTKDGNVYEVIASSSFGSEEVIEDVPLAFDNLPIEAPTILPAGSIASLLLSASAEYATITTVINIQFTAEGEMSTPGDVDGDGQVGVTDVLALIAVWGPCKGCIEDLNNDGIVNVTDLLEVIGNWTTS